jgi:hypothetical protein
MITWGNLVVPYTASWSAEEKMFVAPCQTVDGLEAMMQVEAQGQGKPLFAKPHMTRQRRAMRGPLCDICGKNLTNCTKVSLSLEDPRHVDGIGFYPLAVEPMMHKSCALIALRDCPSLQRQEKSGILRIRQVLRCRVIVSTLNGAATMEFAGVDRPGCVGHLKLLIELYRIRNREWLKASA